ncbi:MAG: hypothetical protein ABL866_12365, partial [Devosia sp.]
MRLSDIYGPKVFLASRPWEGTSDWLTAGGRNFDALTGRHIGFAGDLPDICHAATVSPTGLHLMRDAGLVPTPNIVSYRTRDEYRDRVRALVGAGNKGFSVYRVPEDVLPVAASVVAPELIGFLNNKANLAELAPAEGVADRTTMSGAEFARRAPAMALPFVAKVATDEANGGGRDVVLCTKRRYVRRAIDRFRSAPLVLVEQFVDAVRNDSFQFAVMPDGSVAGFPPTLQLANYRGVHTSNLLDGSDPPPESAQRVARASAEKGGALGYRGICGFDILTDAKGRSYAVDLNYRICASTGMALLAEDLLAAHKLPVAQLVTAYFGGSLDAFAKIAGTFISAGRLVPLSSFDAQMAGEGAG